MDTVAAHDYLEALFDYAFDLTYVKNLGENHVEFIYVQCARVVESYPSVKPKFIEDSEQSLLKQHLIDSGTTKRPDGFIPTELILFMAHRTRWSEFERMAERISVLPEDTWRVNPMCKSSVALREAMSNDWEDAEFYASFFGQQSWPN